MNDYCKHCNLIVVKFDPNRLQIHTTVYHRQCFLEALKKRLDIKDESTPPLEAA